MRKTQWIKKLLIFAMVKRKYSDSQNEKQKIRKSQHVETLFENLPIELIDHVCRGLGIIDVVKCSLTCKVWRFIFRNKILWKYKLIQCGFRPLVVKNIMSNRKNDINTRNFIRLGILERRIEKLHEFGKKYEWTFDCSYVPEHWNVTIEEVIIHAPLETCMFTYGNHEAIIKWKITDKYTMKVEYRSDTIEQMSSFIKGNPATPLSTFISTELLCFFNIEAQGLPPLSLSDMLSYCRRRWIVKGNLVSIRNVYDTESLLPSVAFY